MNTYTDIEAQLFVDNGHVPSSKRAVARAARDVVRRYFRRGGFRDGWQGVHLSLLMGSYRLIAAAKARELEAVGPADAVREAYEREAERFLVGYEPLDQKD
jgi:hypothetical protein